MGKLNTLPNRVKTIKTNVIKTLCSDDRRIKGSVRMNAKRAIYIRDNGKCNFCKRLIDIIDSELDHVVPLQFGGSNSYSNLQTLCIPCHREKTKLENRECMGSNHYQIKI